MSSADIIVIAILILAVMIALIFIHRKRKCGGTCAGCPMAGECKSRPDLHQ